MSYFFFFFLFFKKKKKKKKNKYIFTTITFCNIIIIIGNTRIIKYWTIPIILREISIKFEAIVYNEKSLVYQRETSFIFYFEGLKIKTLFFGKKLAKIDIQ